VNSECSNRDAGHGRAYQLTFPPTEPTCQEAAEQVDLRKLVKANGARRKSEHAAEMARKYWRRPSIQARKAAERAAP
jgi:hypothetical protein